MFGLIVSNRLVDTSFRQVDQTHCVIDISDGLNFNHIVVFLTGKQPFPDETGGRKYKFSIYFLSETVSEAFQFAICFIICF